jgi:hypothetical protein
MQMPGKLIDGTPIGYGLGLAITTHRGLDLIGHSGGDAGYRADWVRVPEHRLSVITLANHAAAAPWAFNRQIIDLFLEDRLAPLPKAVAVPTESLGRRVGLYLNTECERVVRVVLSPEKDKLLFGGGPFLSLGEDRFTDPAGYHQVEFAPWPDTHMMARLLGEDVQTYRPIEEWHPTSEELAAYAGVYWSEETEYRYTVAVDGEKLMLKTLKLPPQQLHAVTRDLFSGGDWKIRFVRDGERRVAGLKRSTARLWNLAYTKADSGPPAA